MVEDTLRMIRRREFLAGAAAVVAVSTSPEKAGAQAQGWKAGAVQHLLPTVNGDRILLKASFHEARKDAPVLHVDDRQFVGERTDSEGSFWQFDAAGLEPAREHTLVLTDMRARPLCDQWPLATFPALDDRPKQLRLLIFTCAGGHDGLGKHLPIATRVRLLKRGLSFKPQAGIANGDHVYWDLRTRRSRQSGASAEAAVIAGRFDRTAPVLGSPNEAVLKKAVGPQIIPLYTTLCRSTPVFFMQDDHDYFENDEADDHFISFPPDHFMMAAGRASQHLYYPEFLPDPMRPFGLPSGSAADRPARVSESYGTLRYGRLAEVMMYDCRRYLTMHGPSAVFVPLEVEAWLKDRMARPDTAHVINIPSTPPGWSAGKWGEWYADMEVDGAVSTSKPKPYWQDGWRAQHDRLLQASSNMRTRIPLFVSGDLHAIGETRIAATNRIDLKRNPVVAVLSGPLGTAGYGWPSFFRGTRGMTPAGLIVDEAQPTIEENGFLIADLTPDDITLRFFKWRYEAAEKIDTLEPFRTTQLKRS
jgi:hypothetical protein